MNNKDEKYIIILKSPDGIESAMFTTAKCPIDALAFVCNQVQKGSIDLFKRMARYLKPFCRDGINKNFKKITGLDVVYFSTIKQEYFDNYGL